MNLSVIIPVYNEVEHILEIVKRVQSTKMTKEIIIVDDGSEDGTRGILQGLDGKKKVRVILHERNQGKGAAVVTGLNAAEGDILLIQDADLEYDPAELPWLLEPIEQGKADAVFGSRFLGGDHRVLYFWHSVGNRFLTLLSNMFTNLNLTDMETCYKMVRAPLMKSLVLTSERFGIEPELTARLAQADARIWEVAISYSGRTYAEGKKIGWRDGAAAVAHIVRFNLFPPRPRAAPTAALAATHGERAAPTPAQ